jgi:phosphate-selective porin OprO/OprP
MIMRSKPAFVILILVASLLLGVTRTTHASDLALEKLLMIFQEKGVITAEEVALVKETMAEERRQLLKKEQELQEREKRLVEWEDELREKAKTLEARKPSIGEEPETGIPLEAAYEDGFCLLADEPEHFSLCLGGMVQADYRYFDYEDEDPDKNEFDIRRARLRLYGQALGYFDYKFEYEFQGASSRNLLDAYVDANVSPFASFRIGQFKEPFSLEHLTLDSLGFFAERSMGYYLVPGRDVGLMAHSSLWHDRINYAFGIFNGDGLDDAPGGRVDTPEFTGRMVLAPFKDWGHPLLQDLQFGGSLSYAEIDRNNVEIQAKTTGLTPFFDVESGAKFNIIREVDTRSRYGADFAWVWGPLAVAAESTYVLYEDITTSADQFDFELEDNYASVLWMVTGEEPTLQNGVFQPIEPKRGVREGGWGAIGLAFRYDSFEADNIAYDVMVFEGESVREAVAYTIALNWYLAPSVRMVLDATRTEFDRPLLIDRDPITGEAVYSEREDVITGRFQFGF